MTKAMLIYPRSPYQKPGHSWIPLGLPWIAALLKAKGHQASIFDRYSVQYRVGKDLEVVDREMLNAIRLFQPEVIGLNTVTPLIYDTLHCARLIRDHFPAVRLVAGGHHATALPAPTLEKIPELDIAITGEGEYPFLRLCDGDDQTEIPGVWCREGNDITRGLPPKQIEDLDALPYPALDLMDMPFYTRSGTQGIRGHYLSSLSMLTSRGCPYQCDFCTESLTYGQGIRWHSPDYVLEWLSQAVGRYRVEGIYFHDNDFLVDEGRAEEICRLLIDHGYQRKIRFSIQTRANRINNSILRTLKKAGCAGVEIGIEGIRQEMLTDLHKGTSVQTNERAIALCREAGVPVHAYALTGYAGETMADLNNWMEWIQKNRPDSFGLGMLQIYPGTRLYEEKGKAFFETNDWSEQTVNAYYMKDHFSAIPPEERAKWEKSRYYPFRLRYHRYNLLRHNSPRQLAGILNQKIRGILADQ